MQIITIRVRARDLSAEMAAMRKWLDEHRCEPSNFTFRRYEDIISISFRLNKSWLHCAKNERQLPNGGFGRRFQSSGRHFTCDHQLPDRTEKQLCNLLSPSARSL